MATLLATAVLLLLAATAVVLTAVVMSVLRATPAVRGRIESLVNAHRPLY